MTFSSPAPNKNQAKLKFSSICLIARPWRIQTNIYLVVSFLLSVLFLFHLSSVLSAFPILSLLFIHYNLMAYSSWQTKYKRGKAKLAQFPLCPQGINIQKHFKMLHFIKIITNIYMKLFNDYYYTWLESLFPFLPPLKTMMQNSNWQGEIQPTACFCKVTGTQRSSFIHSLCMIASWLGQQS